MSWARRLLRSERPRRALCWLVHLYIRIVHATSRWTTDGADVPRRLRAEGKPFILAFWHGRLLPLGHLHRGCGHGLMISRSKDGEYGSALARHWGQIPVRGSTSRGGALALAEMVEHLEAGHSVAFTPDGPRGPRELMKPGPIVAAQKTGAPILPFSCGASRAWYLHSWDRMLVPKPLARIAVCYGQPFYVRPGDDPEQKRCALEDELRRLTSQAEAEAGSTGPDGVTDPRAEIAGDPAPVGADDSAPGRESP